MWFPAAVFLPTFYFNFSFLFENISSSAAELVYLNDDRLIHYDREKWAKFCSLKRIWLRSCFIGQEASLFLSHQVLQVHPNCFCIASFCTCAINIWSLTVPKIGDICQPKIANLEFGAEDMPNSTVKAPFATLTRSRLLALSQEILFALLRPLLSASSKLAIHCFCGSVRGFYSDLSQP